MPIRSSPALSPAPARRIAVVLAGGQSSRFGGPKLAVRIAGEPILLWHLRRLSDWADECWLSVAPGAALPGAAAYRRLFVDEYPFAGPLLAMRQVLRAAPAHARVAFVGGDMPGVSAITLRDMQPTQAVGVMARHDDGQIEPMPSLWQAERGRQLIEWACAVGRRGPHQLASHPHVQCIRIRDAADYLNVNRRDDIPAVERALGVRIDVS